MDPNPFIGHFTDLKRMKEVLQDTRSGEQRRLVLGGMGGIGKTQLAIAYAQRYRGSYESVFWLNAKSEATLQTSLRSIAGRFMESAQCEKLENEQICRRVRRWLSETTNTQWLLIFDNYDDPGLFNIQNYYPHTVQGSIIITTRLPYLISGEQIDVQPLETIDEGLQVLETRSGRPNLKDGKRR